MSRLLPWLHRPSPLAQSREAETSGGEADSDHGNSAGVGSRRNGHRSGIRTIVETHFALTSSRPGHTGMPTQCTRDEDSAQNRNRHPSRQSFGTTRRIRPNQAGSHLGSTLNPGGAVLTLGVFRRSRSVAYIRADASPIEVHTQAIVPLAGGARQASCELRPRSVHAQRCTFSNQPAAGGRGITVTWNPYRGPLPKWRPAVLAAGIPGIPGTPAELSGSAVLFQPPPASAVPAWFSTWVAATQLWGTDKRPTNTPRVIPAEAMPCPTPGTLVEPNGVARELSATFGVNNGNHVAFPVPAPMGGSAVAPGSPATVTALMSAIDPVMVCWMMAGLVYPAETNPLTKLESKKLQRSVGKPAAAPRVTAAHSEPRTSAESAPSARRRPPEWRWPG